MRDVVAALDRAWPSDMSRFSPSPETPVPSHDRSRIEALFEEAIDLPASERSGFLARQCGSDTTLRRDVEALLAAHERLDGPLDVPIRGDARERALARQKQGRQIGPYRVLRELGRGGMGVVYLAERNDGQFHRRVAVKLLQASAGADELFRRFLAERQILASLSHTNIAALLDGGVADGQLPYLVIEYVDGTPITQYADRNRLGVDARLQLFQSVCAAVHHAHQNLVLHRDLKPGNILVTADGQVKLLDFGIAKLLNPNLAAADLPVTRTAYRLLTPAYASPEQVRGDPLTTASDVYSLGLILYELLTGQQAHEITSDAPAALLAAICEREPLRPSESAVRERGIDHPAPNPPSRTEVAEARELTPERLRRRLRGDLDAIVLMALRKEPGRRYGSAELLSADIARHREGLPVLAHRGSGWYRAQKTMRRHRAVVIASACAVAALIAGTSFSLWQWGISREERTRAELALAESQEITTFLLGLFESADPDSPGGAALTTRDLLARGAARADALQHQPDVQARLLGVLARVHMSLGDTELATDFGERMLAIRTTSHGPRHSALIPPLTLLADVARRRGAFDSAATLLRRADEIAQESPFSTELDAGATRHALASIEIQRGDLVRAEQYGREAHATRVQALGDGHPRTVESLALLAYVVRERGDMTEAETLLREAIRLSEATVRDATGTGSEDLLRLAELLGRDPAREAEAEVLFRRVRAMEAGRAEPDLQQTVSALGGMARLLERRGALDDAEAALREIVAIQERVFGPEHRRVSAALAHLGGLLRRAGRLDAAEAIYRRMADLDRRTVGGTHPNYAGTITVLATVLTERGAFGEADALLRDAVAVREAALGPRHLLVAKTLRRQAELRMRERRLDEARALMERALDIVLEQQAPTSDDAREMYGTFVVLYDQWGRPEDASRYRQLLESATPAGRTTAAPASTPRIP